MFKVIAFVILLSIVSILIPPLEWLITWVFWTAVLGGIGFWVGVRITHEEHWLPKLLAGVGAVLAMGIVLLVFVR